MRRLWCSLLVAGCGNSAPSRPPVMPASPRTASAVAPTGAEVAVAEPTTSPLPAAPAAARCMTSLEPDARDVEAPHGTALSAKSVAVDRDCKAFETAGYGVDEEARGRNLPTGFDVVGTSADYKKHFHCAPPKDLDFKTARLAVLRYNHETPTTSQFSYAVEDNGTIKAVISTTHECQGIAPTTEHAVLGFTLPASTKPVQLVFCDVPSTCSMDGGEEVK